MYLKLTFHGVSFYATLLEDKAPILCAELKKACPFEAKYVVENPVYSVKGHIAYYGPKHSVCIWFGDTPSLGACDLFALLDEKDIPRFAEEAQKVWDTRGEIIRVELCEELGA